MSIERWDFGTISYPVPYKFEIGRMWRKRRIVTVQGCEFGMKFLKPARGEGRNFLDDGTIREIPLGGGILIGRSQLVRKLDFIVGGRATLSLARVFVDATE